MTRGPEAVRAVVAVAMVEWEEGRGGGGEVERSGGAGAARG